MFHLKSALFVNLLMLLISCNSKELVNDSQIDDAKMIAIMTEVYYMDSHFSELSSVVKDSIVYMKFKDVLKKYGVTKEQFEKAEKYYNDNDQAHQRLTDGIGKAVNMHLIQN